MASHQPRSCCYRGFKHEGEAKGEYAQWGQANRFEVYTIYPEDKSTDKAIIILTDVIGHRVINVHLIADQLAANGYFVVVPDLFDQDPIQLNVDGSFDLPGWLEGKYHPQGKNHLPGNIDPVVEATIAELRTTYQSKKIGAVGYCFGGKYVVRHMQTGTAKIDAGYTAHPSFIEESELRSLRGPLSIAAAETDHIFPAEKRFQSENILKEVGLPYQINLYSGVEHGFAVRGNIKNPVVKYAQENAFLQAVQWFHEHLKIGE